MLIPYKRKNFQQPVILIGKFFNEIKRIYRDNFANTNHIRVVVFQGHGDKNSYFRISGRVLEGEPREELAVDAPLEENIRDMLARMASKEIPFAQVSCDHLLAGGKADNNPQQPTPAHNPSIPHPHTPNYNPSHKPTPPHNHSTPHPTTSSYTNPPYTPSATGEMFEHTSARVNRGPNLPFTVYCDKEGYFTIQGSSAQLAKRPNTLWHPIAINLEWPDRSHLQATTFIGRCQIPENPQFGVISDIDDTIMYTGATRIRTMLKTTFSDNARSRRPFTGVVPFYQGLQRGDGTHSVNPFFYVSSSPWNLYDFLVSFLNFHNLPQGTLYLRDLAMGRQKGGANRHEQHKLNAIDSVMKLHTSMKFLLVGDSGQHDPDIYAKVVAKYPDRVLAIIIRDVTGTHRHAELERLVRRVERTYGVPMLVEPDMSWPAHFAARRGWIDWQTVAQVERAIHRASTEPLVRVQRKIFRRSTRNLLLLGGLLGAAFTSAYFLRRRHNDPR